MSQLVLWMQTASLKLHQRCSELSRPSILCCCVPSAPRSSRLSRLRRWPFRRLQWRPVFGLVVASANCMRSFRASDTRSLLGRLTDVPSSGGFSRSFLTCKGISFLLFHSILPRLVSTQAVLVSLRLLVVTITSCSYCFALKWFMEPRMSRRRRCLLGPWRVPRGRVRCRGCHFF